jgi:restriction system protein
VEVKHRKREPRGSSEIRSFSGGFRSGEKGLYVSTGGFTKEARYEADRANQTVELMDAEGLARAIVEYYDRMDPDTRTLLPLTKIYWPTDPA